ncbi:MAG: hybrid sensor histidine kinase/response regulator, partial [candidate division Zixibacteria bacterium]|nr:hybrid sensor histidine kinase/response regulator [candidate division Zixibacteria bacterium]NIW45693.1 hybrid sensor histidine kinase/response regulator [Gammaproteobacteria bacterium]
ASIEIVHAIQDDCGPVMGDATQIHQVIMNLCTNAYQAMQDKGGKLEVILNEIDIGYEVMIDKIGMQPGKHLRLLVKDEGCGMEASVLDRIFEPYYTTKEQGKGTG